MRAGIIKLTVAFALASMALSPTIVEAKKTKVPGQFTAAYGKKSQKYLKLAMTMPMEVLLEKAANFEPDYVYAYGLALELGRTPATFKMKESEKARVLSVFRDVLVIYIEKKDGIELGGTESLLLDQPDFWITISRTMSFKPMMPQISAVDPSGAASGGPDQRLNTMPMTQFVQPQNFTEQRFQLTGDPMINPATVSAGQACAIAARSGARMQKVMKIDALSAPHLTPDALKEKQAQATVLFNEAVSMGNVACGSKGFYKRAFTVAQENLGALNRLNDDPSIAKQVEALTALPDDPAPPAK